MPKKDSELNKSLKMLAKSSLVVLIAIILSKALAYVYRIVVARYYGPEVYGLLTLSLMLFAWFSLLANLGLGSGILRYLSFYRGKKDDNKVSYLTKYFLSFLFITGIISGLLLFIFSDLIALQIFNNQELSLFLKIFAFIIPLASLKNVFLQIMQSHEKIGAFTFASKILNNLVQVIVLITLLYIGIGSVNIPISYLSAALVTLLFSYIFCRFTFSKIFTNKPKKNKKIIREIFAYSWPLVFFGFSMSLLHQVDSFMIGLFISVTEVGYYSAAVPIALLITTSVELFNHLFFPLVIKEYAAGRKDVVKQLSQQTGKWVYLISLPLFILLIVFPGTFINLLFGAEYLVAENALRFLAIGAMFTSVFEISKRLILMEGKSKTILKITLIVLVINIILNSILIPLLGITGAAIATMLSFVFLGLLFALESWKHLRIVPIRRKMINLTLVGLLLALILYSIKGMINTPIGIVLAGSAFILAYILLLFITGCLDKNDKLILDQVKRKFLFKKTS